MTGFRLCLVGAVGYRASESGGGRPPHDDLEHCAELRDPDVVSVDHVIDTHCFVHFLVILATRHDCDLGYTTHFNIGS